jgi:hypothetical protein
MAELLTRRTHSMQAMINTALRFLTRHWLAWLNLLVGIWVLLPWLAPVLMHLSKPQLASLIYLFYSPQCRQLPQRSYFLFGERLMIPLDDILAVYPTGDRCSCAPFSARRIWGGRWPGQTEWYHSSGRSSLADCSIA